MQSLGRELHNYFNRMVTSNALLKLLLFYNTLQNII